MEKNVNAALPNRSDTKVAVIGGSGYVGEELVRLLLGHPYADLTAVTSRQFAGKTLADIFPRLSHHQKAGELRFCASDPAQFAQIAQIIFLALPHGFAAEFTKPLVQTDARIVDLSADFRIKDPKIYKEFYGNDHPAPDLLGKAVYGLPEIYRPEISQANLVACPGCYPHEHFASAAAPHPRKSSHSRKHPGDKFKWRDWSRPESRNGLSLCGMQRKHSSLWSPETSPSFRDRRAVIGVRREKSHNSIHAASGSGESRNHYHDLR